MDDGLFAQLNDRPLADKLRPETLDEIVGQEHLIGPDGPVRRMIESGKISSFILWGPPGCGKTTIARLLANVSDMHFVALSAVFFISQTAVKSVTCHYDLLIPYLRLNPYISGIAT